MSLRTSKHNKLYNMANLKHMGMNWIFVRPSRLEFSKRNP